MKKIIRVLALITAFFSPILAGANIHSEGYCADGHGFACLLVGYDNAEENTDVISLVNYNEKKNTIDIVQIPRDTFFDFGVYPNKINGFYAYERYKGNDAGKSMRTFVGKLSESLMVDVDFYIGISTDNLSNLVSSLGGVRIYLENNVALYENGHPVLKLDRGEHCLTAEEAVLFVRHRHSYSTEDLGRLDAQSVFIKGLFNSLLYASNGKLLQVANKLKKETVNNLSLADVLAIFSKRESIKTASVNVVKMPGEAVADGRGIWYYVINRDRSAELFNNIFGIDVSIFDVDKIFENKENYKFSKIYNG